MNLSLPTINEVELAGKAVLVRADLEWPGENSPREIATRQMIAYLLEREAKKIKVIGHKGRLQMDGVEIVNDLRADPREEEDAEVLAEELAVGWEVYVDEAFATAHRKHCSIDALPRLMKKQGKKVTVGMRFEKEIETLDKVANMVGVKILVIGGAKSGDKSQYAEELKTKFDKILKGGLLTGVLLREDGLDIADEAIANYKEQIASGDIIVVAGPMGKYEEVEKGTREVFGAVAGSKAYKIAGGGDTEAALDKFGLREKFDWISVGGGAMLEYLAAGTLPGIEALIQ